nr:RecName: Full=Oxygen-evolving enhancer protein 2; Short=OEE2; AltName: Full=23 kDa subunit of oxygen evolving system of photosystem II [Pinus pinaster]
AYGEAANVFGAPK